MPNIRLKNINNFICHDIDLNIRDKEFLVLWGATGTGKTTLLNIIAGLVEYEGSVLFDGIPVDKFPVYKRKVGYLFQSLVLFPHLNVRTNIAYGLRVQGKPESEVELRVNELLKLMGIKHLAGRFPKDLSGGEKQRVALARATAPSSEIMLLDEPLNSLDLHTAGYLRTEIHRLHRKLSVTTVYVTHCFEEAFTLADRVAVLNNGRIVRIGCPEDIFEEINCRAIAEDGFYDCHQGNKNSAAQIKLKDSGVLCHLGGDR